ncbi:MAG TPA: hypothetical protein VF006_31975 [Longimicrobium sp.]
MSRQQQRLRLRTRLAGQQSRWQRIRIAIEKLPNWVGVLGLMLSIISIGMTLSINRNQDRRWEALNQLRVQISGVDFLNFLVLHKDSANEKFLGFNPEALPVWRNGFLTDSVRVITGVALTNSYFDESSSRWHFIGYHESPLERPLKTVTQARSRANELHLTAYEISKVLGVELTTKNFGVLPAESVDVRLRAVFPGNDSLEMFSTEKPAELYGGGVRSLQAFLPVPLTLEIPDTLFFSLAISYSFEGTHVEKKGTLRYTSADQDWRWYFAEDQKE